MLKIAQLGIGYWGPNLLRNLVANKRCVVKTAADLSGQRCDYVKSIYPAIRVSSDVSEVLQNPEIDAVVIATPVATHFELSMEALNAGKHILVEKPMARA